jgi:hypothetical protein
VTSADASDSVVDGLRSTFVAADLAVPTVPVTLSGSLERRGEWCWSTEPLGTTPYLVEEFVREFEIDPTHDRLVVAHAGHGLASWALCYYLTLGAVGIFVHSSWGSSLDNDEQHAAASEQFASRLREADNLVQHVHEHPADSVIAVVASDFAQSRWAIWQPGQRPAWHQSDNPFTDAIHAIS